MKPTNSSQLNGLMTSIQNTPSGMENSGIRELTAGPDAIDVWIAQPEAIEVRMGYMKTAVKDQVIYTQEMSACCAIVLCTNYDESTGIFAERSLMHVPGSSFYGKDSEEDSLKLVQMASDSKGKPKCIIALGGHTSLDHFPIISNQDVPIKDGSLCKPYQMLQALCDFTLVEKTVAIAVRPDGAYVLRQ